MTEKILFIHANYECPKCNKNNKLYKVSEFDVVTLFKIQINKRLTEFYFLCDFCNVKYKNENYLLKQNQEKVENKTDVTSFNYEKGIQKTTFSETKFTNKTIETRTRTILNYSNYTPNITNRIVYYQTIYLLQKFIFSKQNDINLNENQFHLKSISEIGTDKIENLEIDNIEQKIIENINLCKIELKEIEIYYLLRASISPLVGKNLISSEIETFYFRLFDITGIQEFSQKQYFYGMLEK